MTWLAATPAEGEHDADDRGRVLEQHRLRRRVAAAAHELEVRAAGLARLGARLADGPRQRDPLGDEREPEDRVRRSRSSPSPAVPAVMRSMPWNAENTAPDTKIVTAAMKAQKKRSLP